MPDVWKKHSLEDREAGGEKFDFPRPLRLKSMACQTLVIVPWISSPEIPAIFIDLPGLLSLRYRSMEGAMAIVPLGRPMPGDKNPPWSYS
jgi:hypothetical protein